MEITQQKRPETALPNHLRAAAKLIDDGLIILDDRFKLVWCNDRALAMLDIEEAINDPERTLQKVLMFMTKRGDFGLGDPMSRVKDIVLNISKLSRSEHPAELSVRIYPPNGRMVSVTIKRIAHNAIAMVINDLTEEFRRKEALRTALRLGRAGYFFLNLKTDTFRLYADYLSDFLTDDEEKKLHSRGLWPFIHPGDKETAKKVWRDAREEGRNFEITLRLKTRTKGVLWHRLNAHVHKTADERSGHMICHFADVTHSLKLQDELLEAKEEAEKTLQAQNNFLARLSHEIRTPMNAVIGITDALIEHEAQPAIAAKLKLVQSSADTMMNILQGTLDHSKIDADKLHLDPQPNNPGDTVRNICDLWAEQAGKNNTTLRCHIDDSVPQMAAFDKFRYEQCLNNLISNAVKFTPGGAVKVVLTYINAANGSGRLVLAVQDTGIGMTPEQQSRVFAAYEQGDHSITGRFGGSGLGMSITKQITELMGGKLTVSSDIGKGSLFALSIPLTALKTEPPVKAVPVKATKEALMDHIMLDLSPPASSYENLKILVADDNETNHMVVESLLESVVGEIHTATNGREVLEVLERQDIDIVLMDIHMPVMDGIEATMAIRSSGKHYADILIIALTADPEYQQLRLCKNIGMDETLGKPVKLMEILEAFDKVLKFDRKNAAYKDVYRSAS